MDLSAITSHKWLLLAAGGAIAIWFLLRGRSSATSTPPATAG